MIGNANLDKLRLQVGFLSIVRRLGDPRLCAGSAGVRRRWCTELNIELGKNPLRIEWHKASPCKGTLYILLGESGEPGIAKGAKELKLADVVDMCTHQRLDLATVRLLQRPKTTNVEGLETMGRVRRHAECDDLVVLAIELEFGRVMALVPVEGQQPVDTLRSRCSVIIEVLDPIQAYSIVGPAVIGCCNAPVSWKIALLVPVAQVVLRSKNDEWPYLPHHTI